MKKIYFSLLIGLFMFLPGVVKADSKVCEYGDNRISLTVFVENGNLTYDFKKASDDASVSPTYRLEASNFDSNNDGNYECLSKIYYSSNTLPTGAKSYTFQSSYASNVLNLKNPSVSDGSDNGTGETGDNEIGENDNPYTDGDINVPLNIKNGCDVFSGDMKDWLIQLLDIIKIVGLVLAAILSMVDFLKGVGTGSADTMKKVWKSVGNRLIAVILLFLLPVLIEFIFGLVTIEGVDITNPLCGIK